jgi:hypothetical protein
VQATSADCEQLLALLEFCTVKGERSVLSWVNESGQECMSRRNRVALSEDPERLISPAVFARRHKEARSHKPV